MKKILVIAFALSLIFAGSAFAGTGVADEGGTDIGGSTFTTSTNVIIPYTADATSYAAISKHLNGTFTYSTDSVSSTIDKVASDPGTALTSSDAPSLPGS